ncbi:uncharacterized protein RSE6_10659 [Rhynchosporium secalis]|uniref:BTB domain-containing protein n=1 Tax=Rhynchosporium secalis TaxID=38038 RepID=A0A1E1ML07_RHYSE|nr:uncharacterized protein RSE6_10659 [Rhynchosporium secalis]
MAPPKKVKATPAKRSRLNGTSEETEAPPAKKISFVKNKFSQSNKADLAPSLTTDQHRRTQYCDLEDEDSIRKYTEPEKQKRFKPMVMPVGDFPRFKDGDTIIELVFMSSKYTYQLHSSVLQRASPWFDQLLRMDMTKAGPNPPMVIDNSCVGVLWARFELQYCPRLETHVLERTTFTLVQTTGGLPVPEKPAPRIQVGNKVIAGHLSSTFPSQASNLDDGIVMVQGTNVAVRCAPELAENCQDRSVNSSPSKQRLSSSISCVISENRTAGKQDYSNDDVDMIDLSIDDSEVAGGITKANPILILENPAAIPAEEDQPHIKDKNLENDPEMDQIADATIHLSEGGVVENPVNLPTNLQDLSTLSSIQNKTKPIVEAGISKVFHAFQDNRGGATYEHLDRTSLSLDTAVQDKNVIKKEASDDEVLFQNKNLPSSAPPNEKFPEVSHGEIDGNQVLPHEETFTGVLSTPETHDLAVKIEPFSDILLEVQCSNQVKPAASALSEIDIDRSNVKSVRPNAFNSALDLYTEPFINDEEQFSLATESSPAKEFHNSINLLVSAASPGMVDTPEVKLEQDTSLACTPGTKSEDLDFDSAEYEKSQVKGCPTKYLEHCTKKPASKNDDVVNSIFADIPQQDGPSEQKTVRDEMFSKDLPAAVRQQSSIKGNHFSSAGFAVSKRPSENHAQTPDTYKKQSMVNRVVLGPKIRIGESQGIDGSVLNDGHSMHAEKGQAISVAPTNSSKVKSVISADKPSDKLLCAYNNLFLMCYSRPPIIDTQEVEIAYEQSHLLITVATLYGCVPLVRPYINSALLRFGRQLYMAIMADPPRWIQLSIYLESELIFHESMIHIVGNLPYWPWPSLQFEELFTSISMLIEQKMNALRTLKASVNKSLFSNTVSEVEVFSRPMGEDSFDAWFVGQYWKDWFAKSLAQANKASDDGQKCVRGKVYRDLYRSGETYLPTILVLDAVEACLKKDLSTRSNRQGVEHDLKTLKEIAQKEVRKLCANYSMLSVDDAGINHLTCIKVEEHEFPWAKVETR